MRTKIELAAVFAVLSALSSAAPTTVSEKREAAGPVQAKQYDCSFVKSGGLPSAFPDKSQWLSGEQLWQLHEQEARSANQGAFTDLEAGLKAMKSALIDFPWTLGMPELNELPDGIFVAKAVQESSLRAKPPCTNAGTTNCGILQGPQGSRMFEEANPTSLNNVVEDAIKGKNDSGGGYGDGFLAAMQKATALGGKTPAERVAIATRLYNSGLNSLSKRMNLNAATGASTPSYVSDMANLLTGWVNDGQHGSFAACGGKQ
ncbi:hypothetical protein CAC42_6732 [Sphaceloma murrayae]|uniref:Transglycosylase SLT domain-containing protein n=1 Tax=Sphaceloma murrayae TaxID=2082308 RepID=A0A2K1QH36_9PEZI|nr:hypothetical protein CAC42_6732 [Sphaceloma murrayae]